MQTLIPATTQRVPLHTADEHNQRIRQITEVNVARYAHRGREAISERLEELHHEWDIERTLEANAATVSLIGLALGIFVNRRFLVIPCLVGGFLLQHAVQGWCPPVPFFRRRGVRTQTEIDEERYALKALRGDFRDIHPPTEGDGTFEVRQALRAARQ